MWFKSRLNSWYIWIPSNPNLYSTKIIMKMRWQTIASNVSIRTISPTATPLPKAYDCVAVYIAGRRTSLVVYGWWPQPPTKKDCPCWQLTQGSRYGSHVIDHLRHRGESATKTVKFFAAHTVNSVICNDHAIIDWMLLNFTQVIQQNCHLAESLRNHFAQLTGWAVNLSCQNPKPANSEAILFLIS